MEAIKKRSAWSIFMGVVTAVLGLFLIVYPLATAAITTVFLGWTLIFVGIAQFVFALHSQTAGKFFLKILLGVPYGIAGIALAFSSHCGRGIVDGDPGIVAFGLWVCGNNRRIRVATGRWMGMAPVRWHRHLSRRDADSGEMAFQFALGNRHPGWGSSADGRYLQNHDCHKSREWRSQR